MKIEQKDQLRALYDTPKDRALKKQLSRLDQHCIHFISQSPFAVIATAGSKGNMDASPRGGERGFIRILDEKHIVIPDAKGNNRLDSLENIVETGRIGMLFFIPGIDETLRLNGKAFLSTDEQYLKLFTAERIPPKVAIVIEVEEAFLHCAKAFMRSELWNAASMTDPQTFPTMGQMLKDQTGDKDVPENREEMRKRYRQDL